MKNKFTYRLWSGIILLLLMISQQAHAQYPKLLDQYPVTNGAVNKLVQKGNVIYMAGNFSSLQKEPLSYGLIYNKYADTVPLIPAVTTNPAIGAYASTVGLATADGNGGWYIFGGSGQAAFSQVGGVARAGIARINADGTLNAWNPNITTFGATDKINQAIVINGNVLITGSFTNLNGTTYTTPVTMLNGTTGQQLPGWNTLNLLRFSTATGYSISNISAINNLACIFGTTTNAGSILSFVDVSDVQHPQVIGSIDTDPTQGITANTGSIQIGIHDNADPMYGGPYPLQYTSAIAAGNRFYLSGYGYDANFSSVYDNYTSNGQTINTSLFSVDATGQNIVKFNIPSFSFSGHEGIKALAVDGNTVFVVFSTNGSSLGFKSFDATTGADISASQPALSSISFDANSVFSTNLSITSDHKLLLTGGSFTVNGVSKISALIDITTGILQPDWDLSNSLTNVAGSAFQLAYNLAESNSKYYLYGNISYTPAATVYHGLSAIDATSGNTLNWAPADLKGTFNSAAINGNTLYLGGTFSAADTSKHVINLAAYDITDPLNPVFKSDWQPNPDNTVRSLLVNNTKLYAGGDFLNMGSAPQGRLAEFDISNGTGTLNTTWNPGPDDAVQALAVLNNLLYVGGRFNNIGTDSRSNAAAFDLTVSNAISAWDPKINSDGTGGVTALAAQPADGANHGARVFIGGSFAGTGTGAGASTLNPVVVNASDGSLDPWQLINGVDPSRSEIDAFNISDNKLYAGTRKGLVVADISTNAAPDNATNYLQTLGGIGTVLTYNNLLFAGGDFNGIQTNALIKNLAVLQTGDPVPIITFADITKTYGDAAFTPAATTTVTTNPITYSVATGDNPDNVVSLADGKITILKPGIATITASQTGAADVKAKITVNKAILTVDPKDATIVIGQSLADLPFTLTGYKFDDATKSDIFTGKPDFTTTATTSSPVGTYPVSIGGAGSLASDYYTFTPSAATANITISATGSTPQIVTFPAIVAKTYGDADFDLGGTTDASGLTVTYTSSDPTIATVTNGKVHILSAGTVTINATQPGNVTYAPAADVPQTLNISQVALTIKADDKTINRGDALQSFTATYTGFITGDDASKLTTAPTFNTTATAGSAPGAYDITVAGAASPNYAITFVKGTLTIKGTQIITFAPLSTLTYGDAPFNPGATSDAGASSTPVYTTDNPSVITMSNGQAVIKGAGTATITATFAAANGFELTTATEQVTVQKKQLVVTAEDKTRNYGDANPVFTFTYNGFVTGDNAGSGALTTQPIGTSTATPTSPAGAYPITVSGAAADNYNLVYVSGNLTVSPVARVITFNAIPAKKYGDADFNPAASANTNETPVYTVADPSVATVVNGQIHLTGAGSTTITATFSSDAGYTGPATATQTLTVSKAALTIIADNKSKTQGPPDILLTASYSGFVNSDNELSLTKPAVLTTMANADSPTGSYPIMVSGATANSYDITYVNGTLTIIFGVGQDQIVVHPMLSPNGDGKNDYMLIDGIQNYPDNHVLVVNRNGAKVYEAHGYDNSSVVFSGKNNDGNNLVAGTYYYEVNYTLKGNTQHKTGYIIIKY